MACFCVKTQNVSIVNCFWLAKQKVNSIESYDRFSDCEYKRGFLVLAWPLHFTDLFDV